MLCPVAERARSGGGEEKGRCWGSPVDVEVAIFRIPSQVCVSGAAGQKEISVV